MSLTVLGADQTGNILYIWVLTKPSISSTRSEIEVERGGSEVEKTIGGRESGVGVRSGGSHHRFGGEVCARVAMVGEEADAVESGWRSAVAAAVLLIADCAPLL
jgi:hypothetical protein